MREHKTGSSQAMVLFIPWSCALMKCHPFLELLGKLFLYLRAHILVCFKPGLRRAHQEAQKCLRSLGMRGAFRS